MADPEVDESFSRSFLAGLPAEVVRALRAEGERTENPPGTTVYAVMIVDAARLCAESGQS